MTAHQLEAEADAARVLLESMRDVLADDAELVLSTLEGETSLFEHIELAVTRLGEIDALQEGLKALIKKYQERQRRLEHQADNIRQAILIAMDVAAIKKHECGAATIARKTTGPKVVVTSEADIPSVYWKPSAPTLDKKKLLADLKGGTKVEGALLNNGGETVEIRRN